MARKQGARKDDIEGPFARLAKALSSPRRLELLDALARCPSTVENLANQTGMTMANASQHLQVLRGVGLVESDKAGLFVCYRVASAEVPAFLLALRRLAASVLGDVESILPHSTKTELSMRDAADEDREANLGPCEGGRDVDVEDRPRRAPKHRLMPLAEPDEHGASSSAPSVVCCRDIFCLVARAADGLFCSREQLTMRRTSSVPEWPGHEYLRGQGSPHCFDGAMSRES